jgi:hypothetical protein
MKRLFWTSRSIVLLMSTVALVLAAKATAGSDYNYSRSELMGNSGLTIFREAAYGYQDGLTIYLDGVPITTLSQGEGYRAIVRPGRHLLMVSNSPSPYGKTKFTKREINLAPDQNYSFTAIWDVETVTIQDGGYQYHGFYR